VEAALRRLGLGIGDFEIEGPDRISIELPSQSISMEQLEEAINVALNDRATDSAPGEVEAFMVQRPSEMHLPPGEVEVKIVDLDRPGCGIRNVQLAFLVDGKKVDTRTVAVRVNHRIYGLVASRNLAVGEVLQEADLKEGLVPLRDHSADESPIEEANLLVGATLKRGVEEGQPVTVADVEWEPLAKQGSQVTLVQSIGSVRLTAPGVLMEDMYQIGQTVRVRKANSRKQIFGVATSEKAIRVE
jgi:flagella basal body P-ring formation protein FlgA